MESGLSGWRWIAGLGLIWFGIRCTSSRWERGCGLRVGSAVASRSKDCRHQFRSLANETSLPPIQSAPRDSRRSAQDIIRYNVPSTVRRTSSRVTTCP